MFLTEGLRRHAAVLAVAAGFGVYAASLGGLATIDDELRAVSSQPATPELVSVEYDGDPEAIRVSGDCKRDWDRHIADREV